MTSCSSVKVVLAVALLGSLAAAQFSFASIGDWGCVPIGGWHEQDEVVVSEQFADAASSINARFVLNTGDNFYYCGVHNKTDDMWQTTFENIFFQPSMMVPWYGCLGNHDYGYPGSAEAQINYKSPKKNRWQIPDRYYYKRLEFPGEVNISLVVLDASPCQKAYVSSDPSGWDPCGSVIPGCPGCTFHQNVVKQSCSQQLSWLNGILPTIPAGDWKIAMVHAPATDINVQDLITPLQNANFDLVLNGHVHLMAHYTIDGAGVYITTGAGCMVRVPDQAKKNKKPAGTRVAGNPDLTNVTLPPKLGMTSCTRGNPWHTCELVFQQTIAGYTTHTFSNDFQTLTTSIFDYDGNLLHNATSNKNAPGPNPTGPNPTGPSPTGPTPSPSPTSSGSCCYYHDVDCELGQICCNDRGESYSKRYCLGNNGQHNGHNCVWKEEVKTCFVGEQH